MDESVSPNDRRSSARHSQRRDVVVAFPAEVLGPSANVSRDGIYFFAGSPIPVVVRIGGGSRPIEVKGRLVRADSLNARTVGVAIRFDEPIDPSTVESA